MAELFGVIVALLFVAVCEAIGYGVTYLLLKLIFWCFNLAYPLTWKLALGVYLILQLLKWIHHNSTSSKEK